MDCSFGFSEEIEVWDRLMVMAWVTGKPLQATLDTGCSQTLIQVGIVPRSAMKWCHPVRMHCIHGEAEQFERGFVGVRIANHKGKLHVRFAPQLDCQMIVGRDWPPLHEVLEEV